MKVGLQNPKDFFKRQYQLRNPDNDIFRSMLFNRMNYAPCYADTRFEISILPLAHFHVANYLLPIIANTTIPQ